MHDLHYGQMMLKCCFFSRLSFKTYILINDWQRLVPHCNQVTSVSYHPKDNCMISASVDGTIRVWKTWEREVQVLLTLMLSSDARCWVWIHYIGLFRTNSRLFYRRTVKWKNRSPIPYNGLLKRDRDHRNLCYVVNVSITCTLNVPHNARKKKQLRTI